MCRDALSSIRGTSLLLNLPEFLRLDTRDKRGGDKFDAIQHLTVADYVKTEILHYFYRSSIGRASPIEILGALSRWPVAPGDKYHIISIFVQGLSSLDEVSLDYKTRPRPPISAGQSVQPNLYRIVDRLPKAAATARRPAGHFWNAAPRSKSRPTMAHPPPSCLKPHSAPTE
jgi:hypothetical protein